MLIVLGALIGVILSILLFLVFLKPIKTKLFNGLVIEVESYKNLSNELQNRCNELIVKNVNLNKENLKLTTSYNELVYSKLTQDIKEKKDKDLKDIIAKEKEKEGVVNEKSS